MKPLTLGQEPSGRLDVRLPEADRSTHMHIIGATGTGKSKFIEHLIRQDIREGRGVCLIDPTGALYFNIVRWLAAYPYTKKVILLHPAAEDMTVGFHPLKRVSPSFGAQRDSVVKAVSAVWGNEDMTRTPLLKRVLKAIFHALMEKEMTFSEAQYLVTPHDPDVRRFLTQGIREYSVAKDWEYFNELTPRQYHEEFGSAANRLSEFLSSPLITRMLGQDAASIDLKEVMDQGHVLLVNLSPVRLFYEKDEPMHPAFSFDNARLLGALLTNALFEACRLRPEGSRPFYAYIDEFGLFVNEDIGHTLDYGRKHGLHLTLAHQHLAQLREKSPEVYQSVMADARTKVVFGGLAPDDADLLAQQLFLGFKDLRMVRDELVNPMVVGIKEETRTVYSQGGGSSSQDGRSVADTFTGEIPQVTASTRTESSAQATAESWSNSDVSVFIPQFEERTTSRQLFGLDMLQHQDMAKIVNQPRQHAYVRIPDQAPVQIMVPTVKDDYATRHLTKRFVGRCFEEMRSVALPAAEAQKHIQKRQKALLRASAGHLPTPDDDDF